MYICIRSLVGLTVLYSIAWLLSKNKKRISYKMFISVFAFQVLLAALLTNLPIISKIFTVVNKGLFVIQTATTKGLEFCLGSFGSAALQNPLGFMLAVHGLPIIIIVSAISALLVYYNILLTTITAFSSFFQKIFKISSVVGAGFILNIFFGMSGPPIALRAHLSKMTRSELFMLLTYSLLSASSAIISLYNVLLQPIIDNPTHHIISTILLGIPTAILVGHLIIPETQKLAKNSLSLQFAKPDNAIEAISQGVIDGAKVVVVIIPMWIGFIAMIEIANQILDMLPYVANQPISIQRLLAILFIPLMWLIGIPWEEAIVTGLIFSNKIVLNEVIAYKELVRNRALLSEHTKILLIYALCGFTNLGSIGIITGIYRTLAPERYKEVTSLVIRAMIAAVLSSLIISSLLSFIMSLSKITFAL